MKKTVLCAVAGLMLATAVGSAAASDVYFGIGLGVGNPSDQDEHNIGVETFESDNGVLGKAVIGKRFDNWRGELELSYQEYDLDKDKALGMSVSLRGDQSALSLMANALYDFNPQGSGLKPYLGAGVGLSRISWNHVRASPAVEVDDSDNVLALQVLAGVNYAMSKDWDVGLEYRHFRSEDFDLTSSAGVRANIDGIRSNALMLTFTRQF